MHAPARANIKTKKLEKWSNRRDKRLFLLDSYAPDITWDIVTLCTKIHASQQPGADTSAVLEFREMFFSTYCAKRTVPRPHSRRLLRHLGAEFPPRTFRAVQSPEGGAPEAMGQFAVPALPGNTRSIPHTADSGLTVLKRTMLQLGTLAKKPRNRGLPRISGDSGQRLCPVGYGQDILCTGLARMGNALQPWDVKKVL